MSGILDKFRSKIVASVFKEQASEKTDIKIDDKIALGVLLWEVAQADKDFLPQEQKAIKDVLISFGKMSEDDLPIVLESIMQAAKDKIDLHTFTREVSKDLPYDVKGPIVEDLFRVACADNDLAHEETEVIRKISGLLGVDHKDFIHAKIKVKKEFGLETTG